MGGRGGKGAPSEGRGHVGRRLVEDVVFSLPLTLPSFLDGMCVGEGAGGRERSVAVVTSDLSSEVLPRDAVVTDDISRCLLRILPILSYSGSGHCIKL